MRFPVALLLLTAGCESAASVKAEMERALGEANDGLVAALLAAEVLSAVAAPAPAPTLRHSSTEDCGCPCVSRDGSDPLFIYTLDYRAEANGCVPDSGLVPTQVIGHVYFDYDGATVGQTTWDAFELALRNPVSGAFGGEVTGAPGELALAAAGTLAAADYTLDFDLQLTLTDEALTLDGTTQTAAPGQELDDVREVEFTGVTLPLADIGPPCPRPAAGDATLRHPRGGGRDVAITFADPGDGFVVVTRGGRVSEPTDFCAFPTELW